MICPDCDGKKEIAILPKTAKNGKIITSMPCGRCNQTGKVSRRMSEWIKLGSSLRSYRIEANITLREFSKKTGISASIISKAERGLMDPMDFANMVFANIVKKTHEQNS